MMVDYLREAAELLRQAAENNENSNGDRAPYPAKSRLIEGQERIAMKFAHLGAIERGLLPAEMLAELLAAVSGKQVNQ